MAWGQIAEAASRADQAMEIACEIRDILRDQADLQGGTEHVQFTRRTVIVNLDGTGAGSTALDLKAGTDLHLISYAATASAASTGALLFYMDQGMDPTSLFAVGAMGQFFGDTFAEGDQIPDSRDLAVAVTGGPANGWVVVNIAAKIITYKRPGE